MLQRFFDISYDMLAIASTEGYLVRVNDAWTQTLGWSKKELYSRPIDSFVHPVDVERTRAGRLHLFAGGEHLSTRNRYATASGDWRWIEWRAVFDQELQRVFAAARDVTDQVEAHRGLEMREELLTRVVTDQFHGRDLEQQHHAVVLHDSVAQHLVAALMYLEAADDEELTSSQQRDRLVRGVEQVRASLQATREVMRGLDPFDLGEQSLASAIEELRRELQGQFTPTIEVDLLLARAPAPRTANAAYRVLREGIINACRHAAADCVRVRVRSGVEGVDIEVHDDGIGMTETATTPPAADQPGLGLPTMRELARASGGRLDVLTGEHGTTLHAHLPHPAGLPLS